MESVVVFGVHPSVFQPVPGVTLGLLFFNRRSESEGTHKVKSTSIA